VSDEQQDQTTDGDDAGVRSRTRTRSRSRSDNAGDRDDRSSEPSRSDDTGDRDDRSSEPSRSDGRRRRRGRRGRRGRGRGGGGSGSQARESGGGTGGADGEETDDGGTAIAPGGTRVAAKRRQRGQRRGSGRRPRPSGVPEEVRRAIIEGPPRTMLVNVADERTQVAVMEERTLVEHYVTRKEDVSYVGNIYMGRVQNVLPGMEAAFLDIGKGRNGVLYAGEVLYDELDLEEGSQPRIEEVLRPGQPVLVQVTKDPMGTKGARLTMQLSLAGRYMVLAPHDGVFGISRKLTDAERDRLRDILKRIRPDGMGVIVRTAAADATEEQLEDDLNRLLAKWETVKESASEAKPLEPVYEEPDLVVRVIRDNFGPHFEHLIVDDEPTHAAVEEYLEEVMPEALDKLELYDPPTDAEDRPRPLFEAYHVNEQIRKALDRKVWLPSGGYLIFEKTEAMTVIDVNTGKFTGKSNLEETVLKTNLEAAEAVVQQLRLRDIGGIIVVDFIDMLLETNQEQVVRRLKRELLRDRTKTRVSEVSRLGLVQMTRKNVSAGLFEVFSEKCETCDGRGRKVTLDV
jgi:Rne/Rng family ribonuclease